MTLFQFLSVLKSQNITVTVKDLEDNIVCKMDTASISAVDPDIAKRTIARWYINGASTISVVLNDAIISA